MAYDKRKKRFIIEYQAQDGKWYRSNVADRQSFATKEEAQTALAAATSDPRYGSNLAYHVRTK